ncbi:hypothetical protein F5Y10DRAFT_252153 [Nemania abortiva]|nr:hypothetical protein F5Y10DRAFT_252153 [Nemania abortiva]
MRFSLLAVAALLLASSGSLGLVNANANAEPKPDTTPDSVPTTTSQQVKARETTPNLLSALYQIATSFDLRACIPQALPLVTTLPKIPPGLIAGGAISQALSQTSRDLDHVCEFSITGSTGETFTSFLPTWYSWYNRYSDRIASIASRCPNASALIKTVEAYETCSQVVAQITAASATATSTGSSTGTGTGGSGDTSVPTTEASETTSTDSPDGTAHETELLGAAAAVAAGVVGVIAVL